MAIYADDLVFDKKEQLRKIEDICLPDEVIRAVFDLKGRGTGFLGITDKRIVFFDREFIKGKKAMVSIPYSRIACVASEDKKGFLVKGVQNGHRRLYSSGHCIVLCVSEHVRGPEVAHARFPGCRPGPGGPGCHWADGVESRI